MNIKKITAFAAAMVIAAGICTGVPTGTENGSPLAVTASANTVSQSYSKESAAEKHLPASYSATGGNNTIDVKWDAVDGASSYTVSVMKQQGNANSFVQAASNTVTTTSCKFENIPADTYTISIQPSNASSVVVLDKVVVSGKSDVGKTDNTQSSAKEEFVTKIDQDGDKVLTEYNGKGGDVKIPNGIIGISKEVFAGNDKITSVTFPKSCWLIDESAFNECTNLKKVVFEGNAGIAPKAFEWCISLESVTVKGSIDEGIYPMAFYGCESLKTVKIEKNEKDFAIGGSAFENCYSLTSINIPDKCTDIHNYAFLNCFSLTKLTIPAKTKIHTENGVETFGYAYLYKTKKDAENAIYGNNSSTQTFVVADGKKSGYIIYYKVNSEIKKHSSQLMGDYSGNIAVYFDENKNYELINCKKYTPKQLTLTVTKGSPAEKWAKANGVKYTYAGSSSDSGSTAAPSNIKASKTNNSVTLTWDKADGAAMYRVYKYNDKTGKYEKYKDVTSAKCTVTGLKANTKYKFKVVAYDKVKRQICQGRELKGGKRYNQEVIKNSA